MSSSATPRSGWTKPAMPHISAKPRRGGWSHPRSPLLCNAAPVVGRSRCADGSPGLHTTGGRATVGEALYPVGEDIGQMRYLVTGGAGFIGSHLAEALLLGG